MDYDRGSGEPLLLLHGIGGAWRIWAPVLGHLEAHHRVLALTLPGHAGGPPSHGSPTLDSITAAVAASLDAEGLERVHLAGNSLGGWVALELARRGRALSVTALSPAGAWDPAFGAARTARLMAEGRRYSQRLGVPGWPVLGRPRSRRVLLGVAMNRADRMPAQAASDFLSDSDNCVVFDELAAALLRDGPIAGPIEPDDCVVRIAWGDRDRIIPFEPHGRLMLQAVLRAECVMLPDVGHVPMYDDPELVARTILDVSTRPGAGPQRSPRPPDTRTRW